MHHTHTRGVDTHLGVGGLEKKIVIIYAVCKIYCQSWLVCIHVHIEIHNNYYGVSVTQSLFHESLGPVQHMPKRSK